MFWQTLGRRRGIPCRLRLAARLSSSSHLRPERAIVYTANGSPADVLSVTSFDPLPHPPANVVNLRFRLSPINPADVNVVQGVYPAKPVLSKLGGREFFVGGNEGLAEVAEIGSGVKHLEKGDWVIATQPQVGTWSSSRAVQADDVIRLSSLGLSEVNAATLSVNPVTAYNMLNDFVDLKPNDWVLQNGANSAVGQMAIQIAARRGLQTINFVRNRPDIDVLKARLTDLGATHVFTYDDLSDKALAKQVKQWTSDSPIRLMLNCVGGPDTTAMTRFLGSDAQIVSYGAMSKKPLSLPTSLFIFKNLVARGYWQSRWYEQRTRTEREDVMRALADMKLREPEHEVVSLAGEMSDEAATRKVREVFAKIEQGFGKKILLRFS